jgi:hypothetical protein
VLVPGGLLVAAAINRYTPLFDYARMGLPTDAAMQLLQGD